MVSPPATPAPFLRPASMWASSSSMSSGTDGESSEGAGGESPTPARSTLPGPSSSSPSETSPPPSASTSSPADGGLGVVSLEDVPIIGVVGFRVECFVCPWFVIATAQVDVVDAAMFLRWHVERVHPLVKSLGQRVVLNGLAVSAALRRN